MHGFQLNKNLDIVSVKGFADDTTTIAKHLESAAVWSIWPLVALDTARTVFFL